jgi:hypothetical protein
MVLCFVLVSPQLGRTSNFLLLWLQGQEEFLLGFCSGVLVGPSGLRRGGVQAVCCGHAGPIGWIGCCALASRDARRVWLGCKH